jgi:CelD/BcsL family acetyltransferase involved in cellulose biosynthesis
MQCEILTTEAALAALVPEWESLQKRCGRSIFTAPHWSEGWWRHIGKEAGHALHVAVGRREGRLVAVAPMAVIRRKGLRMLEWAAADVVDYCDFLLEDSGDAAFMWDAIRKSPRFDLARVKDMHPDALCLPLLQGFAQRVRSTEARYIRITWPTFDAWLGSLPYSARKQYRSRVKQAEAIGPLRFEVTRSGMAPEAALATLVEQKKAWAQALRKDSVFNAPGVGGFFRHIAAVESREGRLHFSTLSCGSEIIAAHMGFIWQGVFLSYMASYSARHSGLSPGKVSTVKCMGWAIENGCAEYDFLRGEEDYKRTFANNSRTLGDFIFARGLRGRLALFVYLRRLKKAAAAPADNDAGAVAASVAS